MALIIRDPRNPRLDYTLTRKRAEALWFAGKLRWDTARHAFRTRNVWEMPR